MEFTGIHLLPLLASFYLTSLPSLFTFSFLSSAATPLLLSRKISLVRRISSTWQEKPSSSSSPSTAFSSTSLSLSPSSSLSLSHYPACMHMLMEESFHAIFSFCRANFLHTCFLSSSLSPFSLSLSLLHTCQREFHHLLVHATKEISIAPSPLSSNFSLTLSCSPLLSCPLTW